MVNHLLLKCPNLNIDSPNLSQSKKSKKSKKTKEDNSISIQDLIDPFTDVVTKVLWRYVRQDKEKDQPLNKNPEESQIADTYENIKYFEKQRIKSWNNESVSGEKLSFKGKLGSVKWDDNKSFSFKNLSKAKGKNDERDTINDVLNSPGASHKSLLKEHEGVNIDTNLGFSNLQGKLDGPKHEDLMKNETMELDRKSLASFGQKLQNQEQSKSPKRVSYYNNLDSNNHSR